MQSRGSSRVTAGISPETERVTQAAPPRWGEGGACVGNVTYARQDQKQGAETGERNEGTHARYGHHDIRAAARRGQANAAQGSRMVPGGGRPRPVRQAVQSQPRRGAAARPPP